MATPKPGEIRCPTCHRSTPPAAFCTQCGSAIPADARARPRGMDRQELQERIRARRSGGDPYRRGGAVDDDEPGYERFEPEPEDAGARRPRRGGAQRRDFLGEAGGAAAPPPPLTREDDDLTAPVVPPRPRQPAPAAPPPVEEAAYEELPPDEGAERADYLGDPYDDAAAYPYEYDQWDEDREPRSSGAGAFAILGFLALGVLALLGGAFLAGIFSDDPGVGRASPSPSIAASVAPSVDTAPSEAPSVDPSAGPSGQPPASGEPVVFPDGFVAEAQPCIPGSSGQDGCNSSGAQNSGTVEIWVGFENGNAQDVIGAAIIGPEGSTVGEGSIDLARIGCDRGCTGWTYFNFANLAPGAYEVRITRNGEPASQTGFEVS